LPPHSPDVTRLGDARLPPRTVLAACSLALAVATGTALLGSSPAGAAGSPTYRVRAGDTLSSIAARFSTTPSTLEQLNGLSASSVLQIGETLRVPGAVTDAAPHRTGAGTYTVAAGDTLSSIASRLGVTVTALVEANHLSPTSILQIGQHLTVPGRSSLSGKAARTPIAGGGTYIVRAGDTLSGIALQLGVSVSALTSLNRLSPASTLQIGQRLTVPGAVRASHHARRPTPTHHAHGATAAHTVTSVRYYVVRGGDTLSSIAAHAGVSLSELYAWNGLGPTSVLQVGQRLRVGTRSRRVTALAARRRPAAQTRHTTAARSMTYTVQSGDTLSGIAARFHTSVSAILSTNAALSANDLQVGAVIHLPDSAAAVAASLGQRIASVALRYLGVPYVWGGASPAGFDCSGLVQYVFGQVGISIPRDATDQYYAGRPVPAGDLQPGDVVFFDTLGGISHDGIYIGNGQFVDAPTSGRNVEIDNLSLPYWQETYIGARSFTSN